MLLYITLPTIYSLYLRQPLDESRTDRARQKGKSRRTEQDRVVKDKSSEKIPGVSSVRVGYRGPDLLGNPPVCNGRRI
jgi:hypothetical protein